MTVYDYFSIIAVVVCMLLAFFFAGSETALTASSLAAMLRLEKVGNRSAATVNRLRAQQERMIGALLLGGNLATIAASTLATSLMLSWFGEVGVIYATVLMTLLIYVFCEVLPKTAAINAPDRISLAVARPIMVMVGVLGPALGVIERFVHMLLRLLGFKFQASELALPGHEELRGAVDLLHKEGSVEKGERDMFGGLLDLRNLAVSDVMVHRTEMVMVCGDDPPAEIVREILAASVTRIPIWREKPENIVGILHVKDVLRVLTTAGGDGSKIDIMSIARPPWFVPDVRSLSDQLRAFRRRRAHFALVVDEYGEVMGLVTLEDILEEIVGDISDEYDVAVPGVRPQPDGSVNVDGSVPIRDINRAMDWHLPDDVATTIAGLVIHETASIPEPGQTFTFHGFRFGVLRKQRNRITSLRVTPLAPPARV
jgi:Mg2+/Co2+ transporter CorB